MGRGISTEEFVAGLAAGLVGLITWEAVNILLALFGLPLFGLQCDEISKLVFGFKRINGRLQKADLPFTWFVRYVPAVSEKADKNIDLKTAHIKYMIFRIVLKFVLNIIIMVVLNIDWTHITERRLSMDEMFRFIFCIWSLGVLLNDVVMLIHIAMGSEVGLGAYNQKIRNDLDRGIQFEQLEWQDQFEFEETPSENEVIIYLTNYCNYLLATGKTQELNAPVHKLTDMLRNAVYDSKFSGAYSMLIYYYSWFEHDEEYARKFYEKAGTGIAADTGAYAKRALAYYAYGIQRDMQKARYFLDKAITALEKYPLSDAENRLEQRLIKELAEKL